MTRSRSRDSEIRGTYFDEYGRPYKGDDFPLSALCVCGPTPHEILDIEYVTLLCILGEAFFFHLPLLEVNAYRKLDEPDILTAIQDLRAAFQVQMRLIDS